VVAVYDTDVLKMRNVSSFLTAGFEEDGAE